MSQLGASLTNSRATTFSRLIWSSTLPTPLSTASISEATRSISVRTLVMVCDMECAASAVSSTAEVMLVTVWAWVSIACLIRSAELTTSVTVDWIEPFASSVFCVAARSEEHTSELQSLMRISYAVFCLKKKKNRQNKHTHIIDKH